MAVVQDTFIQNNLKHVIQLAFTGFRQDLLPDSSVPLYIHRNITPVYRHFYDIVIPPFNHLQHVNDKPLIVQSEGNWWYKKKRNLFFFAGTINNSVSQGSIRRGLLSLVRESKMYEDNITIDGKQFKSINLINGLLSPTEYTEFIRSTIFHLCLEGFSPWSPRLYESISLGAIPLIIAESIVLPFERFIDWRSFSAKMNVNNMRNMIELVMKITKFEDYVEQKLKNATIYFHAFRWPYSPIDHEYDQHLFLPKEDLNGKAKNVFHYLSLELRCRRLEQFYGLTSDSFSMNSINAIRQACKEHSTICPCYDTQKSLAVEEYI
jgi:hypothetical protein